MLTKDAIIEKYENGQTEWLIHIEWHVYGHYRPHGEAVQYYPTGEVKIKRTYEHGKEVGEEIQYYRDGSVRSILPFKDGKKDGKYVFHYSDGQREECEFAGGELVHGSVRRFDKDGKPRGVKENEPNPRTEPEVKKILPGDHIPPSLLR